MIGILYEHPHWFTPLFAELERREVDHQPIHAARLSFDPEQRWSPYRLVINRMSPSAWTRGHGHAIFPTLEYLRYLEELGVPVVNGSEAFGYEISKARQLRLLAKLGVRFPWSRVVGQPSQLVSAAQDLRFPVLVKPNLGGSGAGMRSFSDLQELEKAASDGTLTGLGPDPTLVVQEHLPAEGEAIVRIEILGGEFLYAIRLRLMPGSFNLCPADYCDLPGFADGVSGRGLPVEAYHPPQELIDEAKRIIASAGMDLGGVEYLVDPRDGQAYFYDVNALSNFVADAPDVVGFDPFVNLVDFLLDRSPAVPA